MNLSQTSRYRDLPLLWKLLIPFLVLMLAAGIVGTLLIVGDLSSRAEDGVVRDLSQKSLGVRARLHDRELYLVESANLAANLQGMREAASAPDRDLVSKLLLSVAALKGDLNVVAVTDVKGATLSQLVRKDPDARPGRGPRVEWSKLPSVRAALTSRTGDKTSGLATVGDVTMLIVTAPICSGTRACSPIGVASAGIAVQALASAASGTSSNTSANAVAVYDLDGKRVGAAGGQVPSRLAPALAREPAREIRRVEGEDVATLFSPYMVQGRKIGTVAVSIETAAFASARATALRLGAVLLAVMAGVALIGALVIRSILRQVQPLVETNEALGAGDLTARAPVLTNDEMGELARGVNQMAERLQAVYETLEQRVAGRTREIERLMKERSEFFAALSHDLRTPLAVILAQSDLLIDPAGAQANGTGASGRAIKESADQLVSVVNGILDLAKAESGSLEIDLRPVSVDEILDSVASTGKQLAAGAELEFEIEVTEELPQVLADAPRVREVLLNLIDNAVKYTPSRGLVRVAAASRGGWVSISVSDTGVGIPPQAGDRIFEPFYRVEGIAPQRGQASTGLGLALAKRLVVAHGGEIDFTSTPGAGTTFTFTLRVVDEDEAPSNKRRVRAQSTRRGASKLRA